MLRCSTESPVIRRLTLVDPERDAARMRELQRRGQRDAGAGRAGRADGRDLPDLEVLAGVDDERLAGATRFGGRGRPSRSCHRRPSRRERRHAGRRGRPLPICSDVPPMCWMTGVALIASLVVAGYGFSTDVGVLDATDAEAGDALAPERRRGILGRKICASGAVPAGCTGEYVACSDAV